MSHFDQERQDNEQITEAPVEVLEWNGDHGFHGYQWLLIHQCTWNDEGRLFAASCVEHAFVCFTVIICGAAAETELSSSKATASSTTTEIISPRWVTIYHPSPGGLKHPLHVLMWKMPWSIIEQRGCSVFALLHFCSSAAAEGFSPEWRRKSSRWNEISVSVAAAARSGISGHGH